MMNRYLISVSLSVALLLCTVHTGHAETGATPPEAAQAFGKNLSKKESRIRSDSTARDIVFVLDNSDSMKANDPEHLASKIVLEILNHVSGTSRISTIIFDESPDLTIPLIPAAGEETFGKVTESLEKITPSLTVGSGIVETVTIRKGDTLWDLASKYYGDPFQWVIIKEANNLPYAGDKVPIGTVIQIPRMIRGGSMIVGGDERPKNIPAAVERAVYELKQNGRSDAQKMIVLITDGHTYIEDSAREVEKYRWLKEELASASKSAEIKIFGVGLTPQADFELIQTLAQKTDGTYYRVSRTEDIQGVISSINENLSETISDLPNPKILAKELEPIEENRKVPWGLLLLALIGALVLLGAITVIFTWRGRESGTEVIPEACLVDLAGVTDTKTYIINKGVTTIGRIPGDNVDVVIDESTVSAAHAQIRFKDHNFYLIDLGSTNGTYFNDGQEPITDEVRLKSGDVIIFDHYKFKFLVRGDTGRSRSRSAQEEMTTGEPESQTTGESGAPQSAAKIDIETNKDVAIPKAYLVDTDGVTDKKMHRIDKVVVRIGRTEEADITIGESTISARHAQIEYKDSAFYLMDLGSRNGTYLGKTKQRITSEVQLKNDDSIYFEQYEFTFLVRGEEKGEVDDD